MSMNDDQPPANRDDSSEPRPADNSGQFTQRVRHQQLSARVPESVGQGVFATGALVLNGNHEFIIDFLQSVTRPHQVAARVVLPPSILNSLINALRKNIELYTERFGPPPEVPRPQGQEAPPKPPPIEEIYGQLKITDDVVSGAYANTVMITHGPSEFCIDFIAGFYPRSTVTARVYMSAAQGPRLLQTLSQSFEQFRKKVTEQQRRAAADRLEPRPRPEPPADDHTV